MEQTRTFFVAICDDNKEYATCIESFINEYFSGKNRDYKIIKFASGNELLLSCDNQEFSEIHLLFLDIEMPGLSGLEIKQRLTYEDKVKRIVFCTSHVDAMPMAFGLKVMGFMKKPVEYEQIAKWIEVVDKELNTHMDITYENGKSFCNINSSDVEYIEADKDYTLIHKCNNQEKERVTQSMSYWEDKLQSGKIVRVHRSFFVNMEQILDIGTDITLRSGQKLPVGRKYKKQLTELYQNYIFEKMRSRAL